jgi:HSP20 family protein
MLHGIRDASFRILRVNGSTLKHRSRIFCADAVAAPETLTRLLKESLIMNKNALSHWNPFREMEDMQRRISSAFDWSPFRRGNLTGEEEHITVAEWSPLVDIAEDDKEYLIKVELPEVKREDVKVTVENGTLMLSGERKSEIDENGHGRKFHRVERYYGRFERSFSIPDNADPDNVRAEFKDGVLRVHLAKSAKARAKQIEVKVN